jgi:hypothetical protein
MLTKCPNSETAPAAEETTLVVLIQLSTANRHLHLQAPEMALALGRAEEVVEEAHI